MEGERDRVGEPSAHTHLWIKFAVSMGAVHATPEQFNSDTKDH